MEYFFSCPPQASSNAVFQFRGSLKSVQKSSCVIVVGDYIILRLDWSDSSAPINICDILGNFVGDNFMQRFVSDPTHIAENTLDL